MDFLQLAKNRYSSRKYKIKPVEQEKILAVLEAARVAPSAVNKQPWMFHVFSTPEGLSLISECYHREWFKKAPVVILACADHNQSWHRADGKDHADIDLAIAIDHMTLQATSLGLSTCWVCNFDAIKTKEVLQLPANIEPIAFMPLAYPDDETNPERHTSLRKPLEQIVNWH
jgi:nitroreductase